MRAATLRPRTLAGTLSFPRRMLRGFLESERVAARVSACARLLPARPRLEMTRHGFTLDLRPTVADDLLLLTLLRDRSRVLAHGRRLLWGRA